MVQGWASIASIAAASASRSVGGVYAYELGQLVVRPNGQFSVLVELGSRHGLAQVDGRSAGADRQRAASGRQLG